MSPILSRRQAFTLYEVVLAIAILLGAMTVMSKLIATGSRAGSRAQLQTDAMLLCQSKLSEVVAGVEPLASVRGAPVGSTTPDWVWNLEVSSGPRDDLLELRVEVLLSDGGSTPRAKASLVRWMRNPSLFEAADETSSVSSPTTPQPGV